MSKSHLIKDNPMKSRILLLFLVFLLALAACTPATPMATPESTEPPPSSTEESSDKPTGSPELNGSFSLDWLNSFSPQTILLQMDYEPTFSTPEVFHVFGRVPPFTLFADGTLIYPDEGQTFDDQQVMAATLTPEETLALVHQVFDLGFANLESYTDECMDLGNDIQTCVFDASFTILRAQMPDEEFREIKIFHDFANDLNAFQRITSLFVHYTHPNAQPYVPESATLFIRPLTEAVGVTVLDWPLDPALLASLRPAFANEGMTALPLTGEMLAQFLAAVPRNMGYNFFTLDGQDYSTTLVPWLPGAEFTAKIQQEFPAPQGEFPNPDASPTTFANCPAADIPQAKTLRLAYVSAGDLWLWDWGQEPVQITTTGDISYAFLTDDGGLLFYTRDTGGSPELWVVKSDGGRPRLLLSGNDLRGSLLLHATSFDNQWIAFTHFLPEGGGELWVANVDGSDTLMIVSQDDLMSIVTEPNAISAYPAGVTWIPNTYTLTYDAEPGFADGGFTYEQKQNWVVDALTGEQGELFPAGEGGVISYSPDGTTMLITTPTVLRAMNIEAKDLHELDVPYFEVSFGENYAHSALVWTPDSQTLLMAEPLTVFDPADMDSPVVIWSVPINGSPSTKLGEFDGYFPSFTFSPDQMKIAYWRGVDPQSDIRELHLATLDGSENITYAMENRVEFEAWAPDSQSFLYAFTENPDRHVMLGNLCQPAYPVITVSGFLRGWLDADSFLYVRLDNEPYELFLGTTNGALSYLIQLEGWYGFAAIAK